MEYVVTITERIVKRYTDVINADDEDEAREKAEHRYYNGRYDGCFEVVENYGDDAIEIDVEEN